MGEFLFLSTLSLRRATARRASRQHPAGISIHALLAESDVVTLIWDVIAEIFLSTLSLRRATNSRTQSDPAKSISIHALLAESDSMLISLCCGCSDFYPRSPCGERLSANNHVGIRENFYPRSPCGERRPYSLSQSVKSLYFYPRSPCGERLPLLCSTLCCGSISIHALLAESDSGKSKKSKTKKQFLSTLSLRRATIVSGCAKTGSVISIHALLAESDGSKDEH